MPLPDPPWKKKTRPCPFYSQGRCLFADSCNFLHNVKVKAKITEGVPRRQVHVIPSETETNLVRSTSVRSSKSVASPPRSPRLTSLLSALGNAIDPEEDEDMEETDALTEPPRSSRREAFIAGAADRDSEHGDAFVEGRSSLKEPLTSPDATDDSGNGSDEDGLLTPDDEERQKTIRPTTRPPSLVPEEPSPQPSTVQVASSIPIPPSPSPPSQVHATFASPDFLSPVSIHPTPPIPFPLDLCNSNFRRDSASIDSGYADNDENSSWTGPIPLAHSPPQPTVPHSNWRSSTLDLISSPFGSPSARLFQGAPSRSPTLGAFPILAERQESTSYEDSQNRSRHQSTFSLDSPTSFAASHQEMIPNVGSPHADVVRASDEDSTITGPSRSAPSSAQSDLQTLYEDYYAPTSSPETVQHVPTLLVPAAEEGQVAEDAPAAAITPPQLVGHIASPARLEETSDATSLPSPDVQGTRDVLNSSPDSTSAAVRILDVGASPSRDKSHPSGEMPVNGHHDLAAESSDDAPSPAATILGLTGTHETSANAHTILSEHGAPSEKPSGSLRNSRSRAQTLAIESRNLTGRVEEPLPTPLFDSYSQVLGELAWRHGRTSRPTSSRASDSVYGGDAAWSPAHRSHASTASSRVNAPPIKSATSKHSSLHEEEAEEVVSPRTPARASIVSPRDGEDNRRRSSTIPLAPSPSPSANNGPRAPTARSSIISSRFGDDLEELEDEWAGMEDMPTPLSSHRAHFSPEPVSAGLSDHYTALFYEDSGSREHLSGSSPRTEESDEAPPPQSARLSDQFSALYDEVTGVEDRASAVSPRPDETSPPESARQVDQYAALYDEVTGAEGLPSITSFQPNESTETPPPDPARLSDQFSALYDEVMGTEAHSSAALSPRPDESTGTPPRTSSNETEPLKLCDESDGEKARRSITVDGSDEVAFAARPTDTARPELATASTPSDAAEPSPSSSYGRSQAGSHSSAVSVAVKDSRLSKGPRSPSEPPLSASVNARESSGPRSLVQPLASSSLAGELGLVTHPSSPIDVGLESNSPSATLPRSPVAVAGSVESNPLEGISSPVDAGASRSSPSTRSPIDTQGAGEASPVEEVVKSRQNGQSTPRSPVRHYTTDADAHEYGAMAQHTSGESVKMTGLPGLRSPVHSSPTSARSRHSIIAGKSSSPGGAEPDRSSMPPLSAHPHVVSAQSDETDVAKARFSPGSMRQHRSSTRLSLASSPVNDGQASSRSSTPQSSIASSFASSYGGAPSGDHGEAVTSPISRPFSVQKTPDSEPLTDESVEKTNEAQPIFNRPSSRTITQSSISRQSMSSPETHKEGRPPNSASFPPAAGASRAENSPVLPGSPSESHLPSNSTRSSGSFSDLKGKTPARDSFVASSQYNYPHGRHSRRSTGVHSLDSPEPVSRPQSGIEIAGKESMRATLSEAGDDHVQEITIPSPSSSKVPLELRQSLQLGDAQDSSVISNRGSKSTRTYPTRSSTLGLDTQSKSADNSPYLSPVQHPTSSDNPQSPSWLKPLRLSKILSPISSDFPPVSSRRSSLNSSGSHASYRSRPQSVLSDQSSYNRLLSSNHSSLIPEHVRNTLVPANDISPLMLAADHRSPSSPTPHTAPLSHSRSSFTYSNSSSRRSSRFDDYHPRTPSRLSESAWGQEEAEQKIGEDAEEDAREFDGSQEHASTSRTAASALPPSRPMSLIHSPIHAIATPKPNLMFAIASDDVEAVKRVLDSGEAGPNDQVGPQSALAFALTNDSLKNKVEIVKTLLAHGADPSALKNPQTNPPKAPADGEGRAPTPPPPTTLDGMDPATRYYVSRADNPETRRASALIYRSFFRPLTKVRYDVVGQDRAIEQLFRVLSMHSQQLSVSPIVVMLCGPSGHGKSLLARKFGNLLDVPTHTVNMTTLQSTHDIWQSHSLSPYEEPSTFTLEEFLLDNEGKRCVVVLDEIDKTADEKFLLSLLMPWELGRCAPRAGRRNIDTRNVVWLATANIAHDTVFEHHDSRQSQDVTMSREEYINLMRLCRPLVGKRLGASILSRLTAVLPFVPFTLEEKKAVAAEALFALGGESARSMSADDVDRTVEGALAEYVPVEGARSLHRAVSTQLLDMLE